MQNQTSRQELLIFNSMYTIYLACVKDGSYFQNLMFYMVNLYYINVTQHVVNAGSKWDSQPHVHPAKKNGKYKRYSSCDSPRPWQ